MPSRLVLSPNWLGLGLGIGSSPIVAEVRAERVRHMAVACTAWGGCTRRCMGREGCSLGAGRERGAGRAVLAGRAGREGGWQGGWAGRAVLAARAGRAGWRERTLMNICVVRLSVPLVANEMYPRLLLIMTGSSAITRDEHGSPGQVTMSGTDGCKTKGSHVARRAWRGEHDG